MPDKFDLSNDELSVLPATLFMKKISYLLFR